MKNLYSRKLYFLTVDVKTILLAFINLNQKSKNVQEVRDYLIVSKAFWIIDVISSCIAMTAAVW